MARTLIINEFEDGTKFRVELPAEHTKALAFAAGVMDSKVTAYKEKGKTGSDAAVACKYANLRIQQLLDGVPEKATYVNLLVKESTKLNDLYTAFQGKTIGDVRADKVTGGFKEVDFS